jgi:hypothetical protein
MPVNRHNPPAMQALERLLDELVPDRGYGTAGGELRDAVTDALVEAERLAVTQHGRQILAAIEGTTWAAPGDLSTATDADSVLVQMFDRSRAVS